MFARRLPFLNILFAALAATGAEPEVKPEDLPRIPPTPPEKAVETFTVRPGFHVELMAAEPLVVSPVAMAFDENGRLYVVEMIDYSERSAEKLSRIKLLEDTDGDGRYDKATVYAAGLSWATSVTCWDGGVFVLASQQLLYFKDTDGDNKADVHALVASGFGAAVEKLNVQALPNSLQWGPDQRIHGALGGNASKLKNFARAADPVLELRGRDFSFDPAVLELRAEVGGGQWGMTFDDAGRKFICSNSRHIVQLLHDRLSAAPGEYLPPAGVDIPVDGPQAEVFRTSPVEPWRVIRTQWRVSGAVKGMVEGGGRASGYFTGAAGVTIYRGDAYPAEYYGNAFIADCGSNLIHRKVLHGEVQLTAQRAPDEQKSEFAASRDNWCRPVFFANAPDGCLWFCDMARETIEHPWSLPESLKKHLDLNSGNDRGRLYRIVPDGAKLRGQPKLGAASTQELVDLLAHPNSWHRETAARLLRERHDPATPAALAAFAERSPSPLGRLMALRLLAVPAPGKAIAVNEDLLARLLADPAPEVRAQATRIAASQFAGKELPQPLHAPLAALAHDASAFVRYQLAWSLPGLALPNRPAVILELAHRAGSDAWMRTAVLASASQDAAALFSQCAASRESADLAWARELAGVIGARHDAAEVQTVLTVASQSSDPAQWLVPLASGAARSGASLSGIDALRPLLEPAEARVRAGKPAGHADFALLAAAGGPTASTAIAESFTHDLSSENSLAALDALQRLNPPDLGATLTAVWPKLPANARATALRIWRARPKQVPTLLAAIEAGSVARTDLAADDVMALRESKEAKVKARVVALFGPAASREKVIAEFQPALALKGDAAKGHATFLARCTICHRIREEGNAVGPDLAASAAAGREKLLGNILDPSREITAGFSTVTVETKGGETLTGIAVAENDGAVTLRMPGGPLRVLARVEISSLDHSARSLMPEGLEAGLSPQDMADLLEFLSAK